jgi:hypothetical protein
VSHYNFSTRMYIRSLERAARAATPLPHETSRSVARAGEASAEATVSKLPVPEAPSGRDIFKPKLKKAERGIF